MAKNCKTKKILVTAGPVWVPIDRVRVITNIFTGTLGFLIAREAARRGFKTTLLLGPGSVAIPKKIPGNLTIVRFHYFDELYSQMETLIRSKKFAALFHSAAVADYLPRETFNGKIKSGQSDLSISFKPTVKIVDQVKRWDRKIFLAKFKLEVGLDKKSLLAKARESMLQSNADIIVANEFSQTQGKSHKAYIIDRQNNIIAGDTKLDIAKKLVKFIK